MRLNNSLLAFVRFFASLRMTNAKHLLNNVRKYIVNLFKKNPYNKTPFCYPEQSEGSLLTYMRSFAPLRMTNAKHLLSIIVTSLCLFACRGDEIIYLSEEHKVTDPVETKLIKGFYLLNEGSMGTNKSTLDLFDYSTGIYHMNIFAQANPTVVKEMGDVGNDLKIYGSKLYVVINCSNKLEIIDKNTTKKIKQIDIENCRYVTYHNGKVFVSSYAGPVSPGANTPLGEVVEIDTASMEITRRVTVGYQPEEMVVSGNKLYVANSGGYRAPNYDNTVSVINLNSFTEIKKITVGINLHRMLIDKRGDLYVSSRGDHYEIEPNLYVIDTQTDEVKQDLKIPANNMSICGDSIYVYSTFFSYNTGEYKIKYGIIDAVTKQLVSDSFITDGTDLDIEMPYGIAINPETKEIFVTDAQNYVASGYVMCYSPQGKLKWKKIAGNIPAHIAFIYK